MENFIYGRNAVREAIVSGRNISEIIVSKKSRGITDILNLAKKSSIVVKFVDPSKLNKFSENTQGVVAFCSIIKFVSVVDILNFAKNRNKPPFILICDRVQDPHNLGALLRTAYAVDVDGVILPKRRSAPINATVEKVSVGAINFLKIAVVSNLVYAIEDLKKNGVFVYSADGQGESVYGFNFKGAVALVVGSEENGVSSLIKSVCDGICSVPMINAIDSLNVSVAGGIILYEMLKQNSLYK